MPQTTDNTYLAKAVFDKTDFQKNAQDTIDSLKAFENQLKSTSEASMKYGLDDYVRIWSNNSKKIVKEIEVVGKKYSWLEQIAVGCYRKIGESVLQYAKNQVMDLTGVNEAVTGWKKYETEIEAVQTIMNASGKSMETVEKQLRKLSIYTDETSFSYDAMVQNIGKFNAAGVKDLGQATNAMMGIGNMAGYFGVNATKATHAMEGFAKAMGKGYMDNDSWQWIETAGMNASDIQKAFVETAAEMGKIEKKGKNLYKVGKKTEFTVEQFKTTLKDKWLDKDVITATLNKYSASMDDIIKKYEELGGEVSVATILKEYGDQFDPLTRKAFAAAQETKTFSDAIGALKEVTASGWRQTFKYLFGNYEEAKDMWGSVVDEMWDIFAGRGYARNDLLKGWYEGDGRTALLEGIANAWYGLMNILNPIKAAFDKVFPATTVERLLEITNKFKDMTTKFRGWFGFLDDDEEEFSDSMEDAIKTTESFEDACERTRKNLDKLYDEVNRGKWGHMWDRWKALGEAGYVWQIVQNEVNKRYNAALGTNYGMHKVVDDGTLKRLEKVKEITKDSFTIPGNYKPVTVEMLAVYKRAARLEDTAEGIFSLVGLIKEAIRQTSGFLGDLFSKTLSKIGPAFDDILGVTAKWGRAISKVYRDVAENETIKKALDTISDVLSDFWAWEINGIVHFLTVDLPNYVNNIVGWVKKILPYLKTGWNDYIKPAGKAIGFVIVGGFIGIWKVLKKIYAISKPIAENLWQNAGPYLKAAKDWIDNTAMPFLRVLPDTIGPWLQDTYQKGKKLVTDVFDKVVNSQAFQRLKGTLKNLWDSVQQLGKDVWDLFRKYGGKMYENVTKFFDQFKDESGNMSWSEFLAFALEWLAGKISEFAQTLSGLGEQVKEFFKMFDKTGVGANLTTYADNLVKTTEGLESFGTNHLEPLKNFLMDAYNWLKDIATFVKDPLSSISEGFKTVIDNVVQMFQKLNLKDLAETFKDTGIGMFFAVLAKNMASGAVSIASIPTNIALLLQSMREVLVSYSKSINATSLWKIAKSIGVLTLSIIGLSAIPTETLTNVVAALTTLGLVATFLVKAMALFQKYKKVQGDATITQNTNTKSISFNGSDMAKALVQPFDVFFKTIGDKVNEVINKWGRSKRILSLALAVMVTVHTIKTVYEFFKEIDEAKTEEARNRMWAAIAFVAALGLGMAMLTNIPGIKEGNATFGAALSFITMAMAIKMIANVAIDLAKNYRWQDIVKAGGVAIGIGAAIVLLAVAIREVQTKIVNISLSNGTSKSGSTKNPMFSFAMVVLAFALALRMLIPVFNTIANFDIHDMARIGLVMAGLVSVVAIISSLAQKLAGTENIGKGIGAMSGLMTMVVMMLGVFAILGTVMQKEGWGAIIGSGLLAFAAGILAIAAAAWALEKLGANTALINFSNAVSKFGLGLIASAVAIYIFAAALPTIVKGIIAVGEALTDQKTSAAFTAGIIAIGLAILAAWAILKGHLFAEMAKTFKLVLGKLTTLLTELYKWFEGNKPLLYFMIASVVISLLGFLNNLIPGIVDRLFTMLLTLIYTLAKVIKVRGVQLLDALVVLFRSILAFIVEALGNLFNPLADLFPKLFGGKKTANPKEDGKMISDWILGEDEIDSAIDNLKVKTGDLEDDAVEQINLTKKNINKRTQDSGNTNKKPGITGSTNMNSLLQGVQPDIMSMLTGSSDGVFESADEAFANIPDALKKNLGVAELDATEGMAKINEIMNLSGSETYNTVDEATDHIVDDVNETITHTAKAINDNGHETTQEVSGIWYDLGVVEDEGLKSHKDRMYNLYDAETQEKLRKSTQSAATACLVDPLLATLDDAVEGARTRADLIIEGFVSELKSEMNLKKVWSGGSGLVKHLMGSLDHQAVISSPSKAAAWRGLMIVSGLVKGAIDNLKMVGNAGVQVASTMIGAINDTIDTNYDMTPTITPVVDMSNVMASSRSFDTLFRNPSLITDLSGATDKLSGVLAKDVLGGFNQNQILKQTQIENINTNNADVVRSLGELRGDINNLNDSFSNTAVVLDSGALVGATAKQMDNALGRFKVLKGRGI